MKKALLSASTLLLALAAAPAAHAQLGLLVRTGINAGTLAKRAANGKSAETKTAQEKAAEAKLAESGLTVSSYEGKTFRMQRTPADKLPKKGAEQVTALETELTRCHTALEASATGAICTPEQRMALQQALVAVARTGQTQNLPTYQEEAAFYLAEDARRQQAAAAPTK